MPFSGPANDDTARAIMGALKDDITTMLDIGTGNGKYGKFAKRIMPDVHRVGIEVVEEYIKRYKLENIYDEVWNIDALDLLNNPDQSWGLVCLGDVLEHLLKSKGLDLIHFLAYRAKWLLIAYPEKLPQNSWDNNGEEAHVSSWQPRDFDFMYNRREVVTIRRLGRDIQRVLILAQGFAGKSDEDARVWKVFDDAIAYRLLHLSGYFPCPEKYSRVMTEFDGILQKHPIAFDKALGGGKNNER